MANAIAVCLIDRVLVAGVRGDQEHRDMHMVEHGLQRRGLSIARGEFDCAHREPGDRDEHGTQPVRYQFVVAQR